MFPNGNVGLENSKFYEDVPARGHLIGRATTGSCPKSMLVTAAPALDALDLEGLLLDALEAYGPLE